MFNHLVIHSHEVVLSLQQPVLLWEQFINIASRQIFEILSLLMCTQWSRDMKLIAAAYPFLAMLDNLNVTLAALFSAPHGIVLFFLTTFIKLSGIILTNCLSFVANPLVLYCCIVTDGQVKSLRGSTVRYCSWCVGPLQIPWFATETLYCWSQPCLEVNVALRLEDQSAESYWAMKGRMWKSIWTKMYWILIDSNVIGT